MCKIHLPSAKPLHKSNMLQKQFYAADQQFSTNENKMGHQKWNFTSH